jgi:hypothetical protein
MYVMVAYESDTLEGPSHIMKTSSGIEKAQEKSVSATIFLACISVCKEKTQVASQEQASHKARSVQRHYRKGGQY